MKYEITKSFTFAYAHRIWNQELNGEQSVNAKCKCKQIHGHNAKVIVHLQSDELTRGMVLDFNNLGWFKKLLDDTLDHKLIMDVNDPMTNDLLTPYGSHKVDPDNWLHIGGVSGLRIRVISSEDRGKHPDHVIERIRSVVLMDGVPTAENIAIELLNLLRASMGELVKGVEFYETDGCMAYVACN